jgi:hypothetical protein
VQLTHKWIKSESKAWAPHLASHLSASRHTALLFPWSQAGFLWSPVHTTETALACHSSSQVYIFSVQWNHQSELGSPDQDSKFLRPDFCPAWVRGLFSSNNEGQELEPGCVNMELPREAAWVELEKRESQKHGGEWSLKHGLGGAMVVLDRQNDNSWNRACLESASSW